MTSHARYVATVDGERFECSIGRDVIFTHVLLFSDTPRDGFEAAGPGRYVRAVELSDTDLVEYEQEIATWRAHKVLVLHEAERVDVEYAEGDFVAAAAAGFERVERGVYRRAVRYDELEDRRVETLTVA